MKGFRGFRRDLEGSEGFWRVQEDSGWFCRVFGGFVRVFKGVRRVLDGF